MTKKSFVFNLVLAVAFLVVANVKADLISTKEGLEKYAGSQEIYMLSVGITEKGYGVTAAKDYDLIKPSGIDITSDSPLYDTVTLTATIPSDVSYFTLSNLTGTAFDLYVNNKDLLPGKEFFPGGPTWPVEWVSAMTEIDGKKGFYIDGDGIEDTLNIMFSIVAVTNSDGSQPISYPSFDLTFFGTSGAIEGPGDGNSTPEPATLAVLGLGLAGLGTVARRRRK